MLKFHERSQTGRHRRRRGFTLLEILTASAITVFMAVVILTLVAHILDTWNSASGKLSTQAEARLALDLLSRDLEGTVFGNDREVWLMAETERLQNTADGLWLRFFSAAPDRPRQDEDNNPIEGDITVVAYWLEYSNPINPGADNGRQFGLYRAVVDAERTFNDFLGHYDDALQRVDNGLNQPRSYFLVPENADAHLDAYLAGHVVAFEIKFYIRTGTNPDGSQIIEPLEGRAAIRFPLRSPDQSLLTPRPEYADISMTILNDRGSAMLYQLLEQGNESDNTEAQDIIRRHGSVFTRRVYLMSHSR